jgi:hypothetical protein
VLYGEIARHGTAKKSLPVKVQGDSWRFDIAESKYDNHITLLLTDVKQKVLN